MARRWKDYDYESTYQEETTGASEAELERLIREQGQTIYATKKIMYGNQLAVEVYPEFTRLPAIAKKKPTPEAMRDLNDRNSRKECERRIGENFGENDYWITLSYGKGEQPENMDEALRDIQNWVKRLNYRRKKEELPPARYVYVTDWTKDGRKVRAHHHVVIDGAQTADEMLKAWKHGRRNKATPLILDEHGLSGLAKYMTKPHAPDTEEVKHRRKWCASKNLRRPPERKNHQDFRRRKVEEMGKRPAEMQQIMETRYPGYWYESGSARYNGHCGLFYISAELRKKAEPGDVVRLSSDWAELEELPPKARAQLRCHSHYIVTGIEAGKARIMHGGKTWTVPWRACIITQRREGRRKWR